MSLVTLRKVFIVGSAVLILAVLCQVAQAGHVYASVNYASGGRGRTQFSSSRGRTQLSWSRGLRGGAGRIVNRGRRRTLGFNHAYHRYGYSRLLRRYSRLTRNYNVRQQYYSQPRVIVIIIR